MRLLRLLWLTVPITWGIVHISNAQETLSFADILESQHRYFQRMRSIELSYTLTTWTTRGPDSRREVANDITFLVDGERYCAVREGWDRHLGMSVSRESVFDGVRYANSLPDKMLIGVSRDYRVTSGDPALIPNMVILPFWWSDRRDTESSLRSHRRDTLWDPGGYTPLGSQSAEHRGHRCVEWTFLRLGAVGTPGQVSVKFADDLSHYPVYSRFSPEPRAGEGPGRAFSEIDVVEQMTVGNPDNSLVIPVKVEQRRFDDAGDLTYRETYDLKRSAPLRINEPIEDGRFVIDMNRPGYRIYDNDTDTFSETQSSIQGGGGLHPLLWVAVVALAAFVLGGAVLVVQKKRSGSRNLT
jgi:hypothetical protein